MKRARVGNRTDAAVNTHDGEQGFWPSFTDMMSSVALVLFFLMLLAYIQNIITGNTLLNTRDELDETLARVETAQQNLLALEDSLAKAQDDLAYAEAELEADRQQLAAYADDIDEQKALIDWQTDYINSAMSELYNVRDQVETIALLRLSIVQQVKDSIEAVAGNDYKVSVSDNGSIVFSEGVCFEYNSYALTADGRQFLDAVGKAFALYLSTNDTAEYVDSIVISGHTDNKGSNAYNRELSTKRANAVLDYLLADDSGMLFPYASTFCAAGYGATRPIAPNDTDEGRSQNRRIEISITLRDDSILDIVNQFLSEDVPSAE